VRSSVIAFVVGATLGAYLIDLHSPRGRRPLRVVWHRNLVSTYSVSYDHDLGVLGLQLGSYGVSVHRPADRVPIARVASHTEQRRHSQARHPASRVVWSEDGFSLRLVP
jgi:hypothetical protein